MGEIVNIDNNQTQIISKTADYVRSKLQGEGSGHDWWHVYRVWRSAIKIADSECANRFIVELGALLHDIADWKFHDGDITAGASVSSEWLHSIGVEENIIERVAEIVMHVSFKGAKVQSKMNTLEGMCVQDADRLDAIGAIGIARAFAYGGYKGREMFNPDIKPVMHDSFEQYRNNNGTTINHFYEKLLLLKDMMNTDTARKMAEERHRFMEEYLDRFFKGWEGEE